MVACRHHLPHATYLPNILLLCIPCQPQTLNLWLFGLPPEKDEPDYDCILWAVVEQLHLQATPCFSPIHSLKPGRTVPTVSLRLGFFPPLFADCLPSIY